MKNEWRFSRIPETEVTGSHTFGDMCNLELGERIIYSTTNLLLLLSVLDLMASINPRLEVYLGFPSSQHELTLKILQKLV